MMMPGRSYSAQSGYRYGFAGQEMSNEIKGNGNSYTAEYWEYDPRLGRRWNVDLIQKAYESPYVAFGNNPIWNIDPNGADTSKYLSNAQLVDALKIGSNEIKSVIKDKRTYRSDQVTNNLNKAVLDYIDKNNLSFGAAAEFQEAVTEYYHGLEAVALYNKSDFEKLDRSVINNKSVSNYQTVNISVGMMRESHANLWQFMGTSSEVAFFVASMGVGIRPGGGPRAPFSSNAQQSIVESQAGFKFTGTTIKRYVDPSRTVAASDLRRAVGGTPYTDPQGAAGASAYYTTILRNGKSYNLKVIYNQETNTIFHFHYSRQALGPLPKINK
jgi:RHS repeat-associated protein